MDVLESVLAGNLWKGCGKDLAHFDIYQDFGSMSKTPISRKRRGSGSYSSSRSRKGARRSLASALAKAAMIVPRSGRSGLAYGMMSRRMPFPARQRASLKYVEATFLDFTIGGNNPTIKYRANGPQNPNLAVTDPREHQPYGWDQYTGLYDQYYVDSSYIRVTFAHTMQSVATPPSEQVVNVGVALLDQDTSMANTQLALEQRDSNSAMLGVDHRPVVIRHKFSAKKMFAGKQVDSLQANTGTTPSEEAIFTVFIGNYDGQTGYLTNGRVAIKVEIIYNITFSELTRFNQS